MATDLGIKIVRRRTIYNTIEVEVTYNRPANRILHVNGIRVDNIKNA